MTVGEPSGTLDFHPIFCNHRYMKKIQFDQNGIYASNPMLAQIAMQCLEQERQERACRRAARAEGIQWTDWHISDRH